ncbi:Mannan endo-1,6-alpha-mannosidase DCW1 [Paramyrothecium foliicola]|nr:Mannan endo-1,6-alpha-mannosidase DCW1 [Paramyrothecium foliicola]
MRSSMTPSALLAFIGFAIAQSPYSIDSDDAIKQTASTLAWDLLQYYHGNESGHTPGILPGPPPAGDYYWWEGGAMMGTLIDYWYLTGDTTYNDLVMQGMLHQVGENQDYMPHNVTLSLGNDDQGFWGFSAMLAAENKFPDPPEDKPQWLALAQAVFHTQASPERHDENCGGGLRWQIPSVNNGYDYKNSIANGCFFNLGARLARYTKNETYLNWAEHTWDWMLSTGLMDSQTGAIYDGAHIQTNCTDINRAEFSYNNGVFAEGAAYLYNHTGGSQIWKERLDKLLDYGLATFFPDGIAFEIACESVDTCTTDMESFKGYIHRWYATITQVAPYTAERILPILRSSTEAALKQCNGGTTGRECGFKWNTGVFDGSVGAGQTMNVLAAVSSLLVEHLDKSPVTEETGGTSKPNYDAGKGSKDPKYRPKPITAGDRVGAAITTILVLGLACAMFGWMSLGK